MKKVECADPRILAIIKKWCEQENWEENDFPSLLKFLGIDPVIFYGYTTTPVGFEVFKCVTFDDTVVTIQLIRSTDWTTELWLYKGKECLGIYYLNNKHDIDVPFKTIKSISN